MKYQPLHDLLDPEVKPTTGFEYDGDLGDAGDDDSSSSSDAYVIGEDGDVVEAPVDESATRTVSGPKPWVMPAALVLSALFVVLTISNLSRVIQGPPPPPKLSPFQVKQALYLGVMKIDAYRRVNGVTPETLRDAGLPESGPYSYRRVDPARYVIAFLGNGPKLEYDSSDPKESFFGSPKELLTMGETQ